jgi:proteasome assembly chaperone (PAC2) family protein
VPGDETGPAVRLLADLETQDLREPYVVAGFGGWINAGSASTAALDHLVEHLQATRVAELDPEWFYAFSDTRPTVRVATGRERVHVWPKAEVYVARLAPESPRDLILFLGPEPNLRWRTFSEILVDIFQRLGAAALISLGAILAPVHHRSRVQLRGWGTTPAFRSALRQRRIALSRYEGPTGIATILHAIAQEHGLPGAGLTASTPSYAPGVVHAWTAAALLRMVADLGGMPLPLEALDQAGRGLADQIDEFLAQRPQLREQIEALRTGEPEPHVPIEPPPPPPPGGELPSADAVLRDLEDFLKGLRGGDAGGGATDDEPPTETS